MWLLSAMLRHPGKELNVDQIWNEAGIPPRRAHPDLDDTKLQRRRRQLSDFRELVMEFAEDLKFVCEKYSFGDDGLQDIDYKFPHSVSQLIDDLKLVLPEHRKSAIESRVDHGLKTKGIVRPSRSDRSYAMGEDFPSLVARLKRCEM